MKTAKKVWIIIAVCLIVLGVAVSTTSLFMLDFDFEKLGTEEFISTEHNITKDFNNIKIDVNTSDIDFVYSDSQGCRVVSVDTKKFKHTVSVQEDTLLISVEDSRKWYDYIGISFGEMSLTVHLPKNIYAALNINVDTGDITVPKNFVFKDAKIETDTGDVDFCGVAEKLDIGTSTGDATLNGVNCENVNIKSSTGDIKILNSLISKHCSVNSSTGDVTFKQSDADTIYVKTSTGDVKGDLLTGKVFVCNTDTGDISLPKTTQGGKCEITTSTGDIKMQVHKNISENEKK